MEALSLDISISKVLIQYIISIKLTLLINLVFASTMMMIPPLLGREVTRNSEKNTNCR